MSESDTMFNERDRRCTAVQLIVSTDPSFDNKTIASTLKMQIWIAANNRNVPRVMKAGCAEECGDPQVQSDPGCGSRTRRRPTSPKIPRLGFSRSATTLYSSLTDPLPSPTWTRWTTSFDYTSRTSPTWPPTAPKPVWSPLSTEYSPSSRRH